REAGGLAAGAWADAAAAADELAGMGVFEAGTPLRFVHPIVRAAVHDDIPKASRGLRHAKAAGLLAADGAELDAVCAHLLVCEPTGSRGVVERLRTAASRALALGGAESAATYLRRGLAGKTDASPPAAPRHGLGRAGQEDSAPCAAARAPHA